MKTNQDYNSIFEKADGLIIDTNLFLLLLVGLFDTNQISSFKRTYKYTSEDFEKIRGLGNRFRNCLFITPNILTEVTNLADSLNKSTDFSLFAFLQNFLQNFQELNEPSKNIMQASGKVYLKLGLTDAGIFHHAKSNFLVLTDDLDLYHFLINQNIKALNYNHIRYLN